ncbi:MAG: alkaline phosphatase family protein [Rhodospirillales bacterium]
MNSLAKVVVIGIDAGDGPLIERWARAGALPTFRRLLDHETHGMTANPRGLVAGSVWATFYTGVSPARHGQYAGNEHFDPVEYRETDYRPEELTAPPMWARLSDAGRRVAVIDAPYTFLHSHINGINVVDWGTHARRQGATFHTWPPSLADEILEKFGPDVIGECDAIRPRNAEEHRAFRDKLIDRVRRKTDMSLHYLAQGNWDLFVTVYGDAHCAGHQCWHVHEPTNHLHDPAIAREVGDPLKDVYVAIDAGIDRILKACGPETTVIIFCSHGMTHHHSGTRLLDDMLLALDGGHRPQTRDALTRTLREMWVRSPRWVRACLKPLRGPVNDALVLNKRAGRRYFEVINNNATGGVRINLKGREKEGIVNPGAEYDALCDALVHDLRTFVNADTGEPLVAEIIKTADLYSGPRLAHLPDILVTWNRSAPIRRVASPKTGAIENRQGEGRTGDHTMEGKFFVVGRARNAVNRPVPVTDFAATVVGMLNVTAPDLEGRPIPEILRAPAKVA